jgi:hypothetical protein
MTAISSAPGFPNEHIGDAAGGTPKWPGRYQAAPTQHLDKRSSLNPNYVTCGV